MKNDAKNEMIMRREKFISCMQPNSIALFFSSSEKQRSNDTYYPYRQHSDFWYFTFFDEPEAVLAIIKKDDDNQYCVLFNRKKEPLAETWTGYRLGQDLALEKLAVDEAYPIDHIENILPNFINGKTALYHAEHELSYADTIVKKILNNLRKGINKGLSAPQIQIDWRPIVHNMRIIKSEFEISLIREACHITAQAHKRAMQKCKPQLYEYQLESEVLYEFSQRSARCPSYNTIVGGGNNACILHYEKNSDQLKDGDLVLIDAGCEYQYYAGDITRTFPVNGQFSTEQLNIYRIVLSAQQLAIKLLKPGTSIIEVDQHVIKMMVSGLIDIGIIKDDIDTVIKEKTYSTYYMHGLGHWLGIDVHDVGGTRARKLEPGMVLTVEPGLYINQKLDVPEAYKGIGIRIEDNILITETGNEVLTNEAPKDPADIENLMKKVKKK